MAKQTSIHRSVHCNFKVDLHPEADRSPLPICFTESALRSLLLTVGSLPAETGAKGYGPKDRVGFDLIEFDWRASSTSRGSAYAPDVEWSEERRQFHLNQLDESLRVWTGDIHSHPGSLGHPSRKVGHALGDLGYVEAVFEENESLLWFFIPILTLEPELVIHPWVCRRDRIHSPMIADIVVCDADEFPVREFNPEWLQRIRAEEVLGGREAAQFSRFNRVHPEHFQRDYLERQRGLVSASFQDKKVLTVGVGAGSFAVEKLARLSPAVLKNCDFDMVETSNLSRTNYTVDDLGTPKVDALERRIRRANPLVDVRSYNASITDMSPSELDEMFDGADLVIAGTDDFCAQARVNSECVPRRIPAVFIGIHARGHGGRIIWYMPGETGCYQCVARERYLDASTGELAHTGLEGAVGTVIDCQFIDSIALKIVVSILERGQRSDYGQFYEAMKGRNDVVVRCHPDYVWGTMVWDAVLSDLPTYPKQYADELKSEALLAMDAIWLKGRIVPGCPTCGTVRKEESSS